MTECPFSLADQCVPTVSHYQPVHPFICSHSHGGLGQHQLWARTPTPGACLVSTLTDVGLCGPGARCLETETQTCTRVCATYTHTQNLLRCRVQSIPMDEGAKCSGNIEDGRLLVSAGDPERLLRGGHVGRKSISEGSDRKGPRGKRPVCRDLPFPSRWKPPERL